MSNLKPITDEELAKMKVYWEGRNPKHLPYEDDLPRCIAEIARLKEEVSTLRQLREYDAKDLLERRMKNLDL